MNEKNDPMSLVYNLTVIEVVDLTQELLRDALAVVSASRKSKLKTSDGLFNGPLVRDLLLSWASRAMVARLALQFWMETNGFASGLTVLDLGQSYTHGSVLVMDLIEHLPTIASLTERLGNIVAASMDADTTA